MLKTNIEKIIVTAIILSAILGYNISYEKVYLFHIMILLYYFLIFTNYITIKKSTINKILPIALFGIYFIFTLLWTPNKTNGAIYVFYLLCAFSLILSIVNFSIDKAAIFYALTVITLGLMVNFFIGVIESTGHFRMPASPYAIQGTLKNIDANFNSPSGFFSNLNDFGFVFIIFFPFFFFNPKKIIRYWGFILLILFIITLQSKGFFLSTIIFFSLYFIINIRKKGVYILLMLATIATPLLILLSIETEPNSRIFTLLDQIHKGVSLILSGDINPSDSTSTRAYYYLTGIKSLIESYGLGTGIAGISSLLAQDNNTISFHFFFLELLIDIGVIPFIILMYCYFKKIWYLLKSSKNEKDYTIKYIKKSIAFALLIAIPASIAPSSIIYLLSFWVLIGLSLCFKKNKYQVTQEKNINTLGKNQTI